jgi:hypothetical protein
MGTRRTPPSPLHTNDRQKRCGRVEVAYTASLVNTQGHDDEGTPKPQATRWYRQAHITLYTHHTKHSHSHSHGMKHEKHSETNHTELHPKLPNGAGAIRTVAQDVDAGTPPAEVHPITFNPTKHPTHRHITPRHHMYLPTQTYTGTHTYRQWNPEPSTQHSSYTHPPTTHYPIAFTSTRNTSCIPHSRPSTSPYLNLTHITPYPQHRYQTYTHTPTLPTHTQPYFYPLAIDTYDRDIRK